MKLTASGDYFQYGLRDLHLLICGTVGSFMGQRQCYTKMKSLPAKADELSTRWPINRSFYGTVMDCTGISDKIDDFCSEWGHDFRPDYRKLRCIRDCLPGVPMMALTATAVPRVQEDIVRCLGMVNPLVSKASFDRSNLVISITRKSQGQIHNFSPTAYLL